MSSIPLCTCLPCFSETKPPPPCSSLSCLSSHCPCGSKRLFRKSGRTLVCMAYGMFYHVALSGQTLCLFVFPSPSVRGVPKLHHLLRDASCFIIRCDYLVFHAGVKKKQQKTKKSILAFCRFHTTCCCCMALV